MESSIADLKIRVFKIETLVFMIYKQIQQLTAFSGTGKLLDNGGGYV